MSIIKISFPEDFNKKYKEFHRMLSDIMEVKEPPIFGDTNIKIQKETESEEKIDSPENIKPHTIIKDGVGYFKFYKEGANIKIGKRNTRQFRFLQCLCNPTFGIERTIEEVFEAIKLKKDFKDDILGGFDSPQKETRKLTIIKNSCIKELQKIKEIQKINYKFDNYEKRVWLALEG